MDARVAYTLLAVFGVTLWLVPNFPGLSRAEASALGWGFVVGFIAGTPSPFVKLSKSISTDTVPGKIVSLTMRGFAAATLIFFAVASLSGMAFVPEQLADQKLQFMIGTAAMLAMSYIAFWPEHFGANN